jgi:hypothetical protein
LFPYFSLIFFLWFCLGAVDPFLTKLDNVTDWEDPTEYFKTIQKEQKEQQEMERTNLKLMEKEKEKATVRRLTQLIANSNDEPMSPLPFQKRIDPLPDFIVHTGSRAVSRQTRPSSKQVADLTSADHEMKEKESHHPSRKQLDFLHLFKDQPDAHFFPQGKNRSTSPGKHRSSRSNSPHALGSPNASAALGGKLSPGNSPNRFRQSGERVINHGSSPNHHQHGNSHSNTNSKKPSSPTDDKRYVRRKEKKNTHQQMRNSFFFGTSTEFISNNPINRRPSFLQSVPRHTSTNSAIGFLTNEESITLQSSSIESESSGLALVHNEYAEVCLLIYSLNFCSSFFGVV